MTPWGFVVVALAQIAAPFFIAPIFDRKHPAFTPFGLGLGLALGVAFGTWRLVDTLPRLGSVDSTSHGFLFQALMVAVGTLAATAAAALLLLLGVAIGGLFGRWFRKTAT